MTTQIEITMIRGYTVKLLAIFVIASMSLFGCSRTQTNSKTLRSKAPITGPTVILDGSSWQWADLSRKQYAEVVHGGIDPNSGKWEPIDHNFLPEDDPRSVKLQKYASDIDDYVRQVQPDLSRGIPRPEIIIDFRDKPGVLAVTKNVFSCFSAKFRREGTGNTVDFNRLTIQMHLSLEPTVELPCAQLSESDRLIDYIKFVNEGQLSNCRYNISTTQDGTTEIVANDQCIVFDKEFQQISGEIKADQIVFFQTANQIVVYKSLLDRDDDTYLASVIAHELAHYYRAHPVNFPEGLTYQIGNHNFTSRPKFNESNRQLLNNFFTAKTSNPGWMKFYKVKGQKFHPGSFNMTNWFLEKISQNQCEVLRQIWAQREEKWKNYPFAILSEEHHVPYFQYETAARVCFSSQNFSQVFQDFEEFKLFFGMDPVEMGFITLYDAFLAFSDKNEDFDREILPKLQEIIDNNIFSYNFELEADEVSINFANSLDLTSKEMILYDLNSNSIILDDAKCRESVAAYLASTDDPWQGLVAQFDGPFMPGVISNPENSDCFRVVNKAISFKRRQAH